jgi:hypothetical protein
MATLATSAAGGAPVERPRDSSCELRPSVVPYGKRGGWVLQYIDDLKQRADDVEARVDQLERTVEYLQERIAYLDSRIQNLDRGFGSGFGGSWREG